MTSAKFQKSYDPELILNRLRLRSLKAERELFEKYPEVKKFLSDRNVDLGKLRNHSARVITTGALTGALMFTTPTIPRSMPDPTSIVKNIINFDKEANTAFNQEKFLSRLWGIIPPKATPLTRFQEKQIEQAIKEFIGINAKASLEGEHLNATYGYIGLEQHLMRYPGDYVYNMAPGRGAWGYFARSKLELTAQDIEREKWYVAVQTMYLPDWEKRLPYIKDWYKFRKVLVVNTLNGNAVVGDIADAGPAAWTGKQFGGSPEVMDALGGKKYKKGPVIIFFVDDPENKIPLGPVEYNNLNVNGVKITEV